MVLGVLGGSGIYEIDGLEDKIDLLEEQEKSKRSS